MIRTKLISTIAISILVAVGASVALAQGGRYGNVYSRSDIDGFIRNLETSSDVFSRDFKNAGGTTNNERRIVDRFENAVDRLRSRFNSGSNWWVNKTEVQAVMNEASQVNVMMNNERYARPLERQWRDLRRDINKLADTYELQGLGGNNGIGNGGGNGNWNGGGMSRPPGWAVGTWYWVQGPNRSFTLDANGVVTENAGGYGGRGTYNRGAIYLNGNRSTVTRTSTGIRTYNESTGETSDYTRGNNGGVYDGGGYNPGIGDGNMTRPPSWALGTWSWVQGYGRQFTIEANGRVVEDINGRVSYGSYNNGVIMLNGNSSTVTRTRNGIRTYNQSTGETSDYVHR